MKLLKEIVQGARYLEGYGHHPGNATMLFIIGANGVICSRWTVWGFLVGIVVGVIALLPFWCVGCVSRVRSYQRSVERTFNIMKET